MATLAPSFLIGSLFLQVTMMCNKRFHEFELPLDLTTDYGVSRS